MRQNRIVKIAKVPWLRQLVELDLYDNGLTAIDNLNDCSNLKYTSLLIIVILFHRSLDLSFNRINKISGLSELVNLEQLYLISNGIQEIENLPNAPSLKYLELGANKITAIENLDPVPNVEQLFFGQNRLTSMLGLDGLRHLRVLSLQSNRITRIEALDPLQDSLEELYLSHNRIEDLAPLKGMKRLRILDVSNNQIKQIPSNFGGDLPSFEEFWASSNLLNNLIDQLDRFDKECAQRLTTVYLAGSNPMANHPRYVAVVKQTFPNLKQIDGTVLSWD